ncbi:MAG: lytic murein transglycosylase [Phenylobacterium sp.]|uniref:lytic murein transglycosylase n=1 Tax=Phenylobacterium sp. TaxID=1871053 RepID=UPI001B42EDDD|nr:lytic murein transglycosylase [Phenylobacterium sp.]MBP7650537.1 lytic murein transglycosylase [Phenylobacterium sp.]MBP7816506.1 lytic murein transglycosylase [Phenylobacterium sp.]MBP9231159.1 lytic murein transglycosylase [Phenylobacterium sp.]MBP9754097.1 lytic murein transglycosylase [Phenylobacterium sp.]
MDRRVFLVLLLAGCADPSTNLVPVVTPAPPAPTPQAPAPVTPPTVSGDRSFDDWARDFYTRAVKAGLPASLLDREMAGLTPDPRVNSLDTRQPEFAKPFGDYIKGVVSEDRVAIAARRKPAMVSTLTDIEARYGVPGDILLAIWAMETGFGSVLGDFDVVRSMATLAAQGRRQAFAEDQLMAALRIIGSGEFPRSKLRGSWAGAMGQTQFIPTSFLATAVDGDGDGRRDVWSSSTDALASAANLLAKGGWQRGQGWAREVTVPDGFDYSLTEGPREIPDWWAQHGVRRSDGLPWSSADAGAKAMLITPTGAQGPAFLLFPNHFVIRKYNNATTYALGVGLLADRFGGMDGVIKPWPYETALSIGDRIVTQRALAQLGFDPGAPDGVVGVNTRNALRSWQKSRGLTADGYLSLDMVRRLKTEANIL